MRVPEGWSSLQISEVLERVSDPIFPEPEENYYQIGIRSHGKGLFHKEPVTGEALGNKRVFRIHPDCFIVNIVFAWEQAVAKTSGNETGMIASHRFPMFRPKNNLCDVDYLTYFFKAPKGKYLLGLASPGGAGRNKTLGQSEFYLLRITLPPTKEQQKIAQILSTWDKAIEKLEALIVAKQKRKKALMQQLLTGKVRFAGFDGEWNKIAIKQMGKVVSGGTPDTNIKEYWAGDILWMTPTDVTALQTRFINNTKRKITQEGIKNSSATVVPSGSLLVCTRATIGVMSISTTDITTNQGFKNLVPSSKFDVNFLYYLFNFFKKEFIRHACGSTFFELSKQDFEKLVFECPELKEQQKTASALSTADNEITIHQNQLSALKQQKTALMQQLLTGKKRVQVDQVAA
jgi:type I restriction enzyme S subunit